MESLNFKLSIIIPIYNNSEYLKPLLESLKQQKKNREDIEIIAVDDGSTQDMRFLDNFADVVIHKVNGGCASARNAGLDAARGNYVAFLDADDAVKSNYIDVIYEDATRGYDYVTYWWDLDDGKSGGHRRNDPWRPNYNVWSYLFKKSILEGKRFDERRNAADDWVFVQDVIHTGLSRYDSKQSLVIYNTHNENSLTKRVERGELSEFK